MELQYEKDSKERIPYEHYLERFQKSDPKEISQRTGIPYDPEQRVFTRRLMGVTYQIRYPAYEVRLGFGLFETVYRAVHYAAGVWIWKQTGTVSQSHGDRWCSTSESWRYIV